jgi:hypothetical protein
MTKYWEEVNKKSKERKAKGRTNPRKLAVASFITISNYSFLWTNMIQTSVNIYSTKSLGDKFWIKYYHERIKVLIFQ